MSPGNSESISQDTAGENTLSRQDRAKRLNDQISNEVKDLKVAPGAKKAAVDVRGDGKPKSQQ